MILPPSAPFAAPASPPGFFERPAAEVAPELVGCAIRLRGAGGRIVETEAYAASDPASHSFRGPTARNTAMFGPPGRAYVYRSHGLHWCLNLVCLPGDAVLLRALEPLLGVEEMAARRGGAPLSLLCAGPGRLAQALGVGPEDDGRPLDGAAFALHMPAGPVGPVAAGPRIGISRGVETPWRFRLQGSPWLSRRDAPPRGTKRPRPG